MYKLYWSADSGAFVVHAALTEAGAEYQLSEIDFGSQSHRSPEFLKINPMGQIPALALPDGSVITESVAILLYLAEACPESKLLPEVASTSRAQAMRWLLFMATNTYLADCRYYHAERYTTSADGVDGVKAAGLNDMDRNFDLLDSVLAKQDFLAGSEFSIADTYLAMVVTWHPDVSGVLVRHANIDRVFKIVRGRPAIEKIWNQNFPDE